jgi:NAD+ diphosphatase
MPSPPIPDPNFLAGPYIDRRAEWRERHDWPEQARNDPQARFMVARGTAQLIAGAQPSIVFVDATHPLVRRATDQDLVLLGWYRDAQCLLLQLDEADDAAAALAVAANDDARFEDLRPLAPQIDATEAGLLAYARAIVHWQRRHRHCGICGAPSVPTRAGHVMCCTSSTCGTEFFPRIDPAIIVLVSDGERALLGRQASWAPGRYSTIAGFVEPGESLEDAVGREVLEETGVSVAHARYHSSQPWPFPASLMLGFEATAAPGSIARAGSELEDARWFTREELLAGAAILPPATSISRRLIERWLRPQDATRR